MPNSTKINICALKSEDEVENKNTLIVLFTRVPTHSLRVFIIAWNSLQNEYHVRICICTPYTVTVCVCVCVKMDVLIYYRVDLCYVLIWDIYCVDVGWFVVSICGQVTNIYAPTQCVCLVNLMARYREINSCGLNWFAQHHVVHRGASYWFYE